MNTDAEVLKKQFAEEVTAEFLDEVVQLIRDIYPEALEFSRDVGFSSPEVRDSLSSLRRGMIEPRLREIARKHDLTARVGKNRSKNSHTKVFTERFVITQSRVRNAWDLVRQADFRDRYSRNNNRVLFEDLEEDPPEETQRGRVHAIILHAEDPEDRGAVSFIGVGFPAPDGRTYVARLDLTNRLTLTQGVPSREAEQIPAAPIRPRKKSKSTERA